MTSDQNGKNDKQDIVKRRIITFFIQNGFLVSTELMNALLQERNPMEVSNKILSLVREKAASLAVITIKDIPQGVLTIKHDTTSEPTSFPTESTTDESLTVIESTGEENTQPQYPPQSRNQWNFKIINYTHQISFIDEITTKMLQELQKLHDLEVAREYLRLLQNSEENINKEDVNVAIIIQKQQIRDNINFTLELPLKQKMLSLSLESSHFSNYDFELLSRLPIHSMIGLIIDQMGKDNIMRLVKPINTQNNTSPRPNDASRQPHRSNGNDHALIFTMMTPMASEKYEFPMNLMKFIENEAQLQYIDEKQAKRTISLNEVQLILVIIGATQNASQIEKALLTKKSSSILQFLTKLDELIISKNLPHSPSIIVQGQDPFWPQSIIPMPPTSSLVTHALPKSINLMTTPGMIEIMPINSENDNTSRARDDKTIRIFSFLGLGTSREMSLRMIKYMIELRHIHLTTLDIIHLSPKNHSACVFESLPDVFIHDVRNAPPITNQDNVIIINVSQPDTKILIDLNRHSAFKADFIEKDEN